MIIHDNDRLVMYLDLTSTRKEKPGYPAAFFKDQAIKPDARAMAEELGQKEGFDEPFVFTPGSSKFYGIGTYLGNVSDLARETERR
jgi:hypothetical protein